MTDKQIIIDGVDVSGCEFFETKAQVMQCHIGILTQRCKANNCYYKQLKRSEAQCEGMFVSHTDLEKKYKAKEQECETLASQLDFEVQKKECLEQECEELKDEVSLLKESNSKLQRIEDSKSIEKFYLQQLDQLKSEVKSKTEYIQEQRDIINQYSKEIEMYKKCQGKRASKREEELKAENKRFKETLDELFKTQYTLADINKKLRQCLVEIKEIAERGFKLRQCLVEIKEIAERGFKLSQCNCGAKAELDLILQKISEYGGNDE